ncbi:hypothetical protein DIC66_08220 [Rhodoferax lacus]|uniref:FecR protein domain-containing protein n=1 Tax=Rhodoferax lacus TaxID=2184758 RepID=A0A3E1RDM2_9BURK|nr:DUF6600 domain-containing protein [Rhodoferax lacus]RFO97122.1 hypothetical protein DIC66_08220 [Rhodoferax lacus]
MIALPTWRTVALSLALLLLGSWAQAQALTRVARLGYLEGEVSFLAAGDADWVQASLNRPLTTGDHLWTDRSAVAELQLETAAVRMGERSNLTVLNLDERITQLQLSQGALRLRVRALAPQQSIEVNTPNLALVLRRAGDYRIEVDPQADATLVLVQGGEAEVFGEGASYRVDRGQAYRFYGTDLYDYTEVSDYRADELDRWAAERERRLGSSASARYVPAGVVGYEDLDANGRWVVDVNYGNVWLPSRVAVGWTPYRDGRWTWVNPWGWTWIDDAPWGYAVSHYGRWAYMGNAWGWVPGAKRERVVYAPALVVFVGGNQARNAPERHSGMGNTGWFPLGPREVYRPGQAPGREGYANQRVRGAVVAPDRQPQRGRAPEAEARSRPPRDNQPVVARTAPPAPVMPQRADVPAQAPTRVRVVTAPGAAAPIALPPQAQREDRPREDRPREDRPRDDQSRQDQQRQDQQRQDQQRNERRPEAARPAAPAAAPNAAPIAAPVRVGPKRNDTGNGDAPRNDAARNDAARGEGNRNDAARAEAQRAEAGRAEASRNAAAQADAARNNAARAEAAKAEAAKAEAGNAARAEQSRPPGRNADAPRGKGQRPERELTPEEELLRKRRQ